VSATDLKRFVLALLMAAPCASATPGVDALPQPITNTPINIEAIANGYSKIEMQKTVQDRSNDPALLVFVSLDMPQATLKRLLDQVELARGRILVRGFKNGSLRETVIHIHALIGSRKSGIQVDPRAFDHYAITRVPTFVLVRAGEAAKVAGDVSLEYALEHIERYAPAHQADAARFMARLRK
jgi:conjugal transfer pilus assembly protein TrbC